MGSPVGYGGGRCPTAGSESAAVLKPLKDEPFILASVYGDGDQMDESTGSGWIYADGSAPSVVSGPSRLIGQSAGHGMIAAGDPNLLPSCYGERSDGFAAVRYATKFDRMGAEDAVS